MNTSKNTGFFANLKSDLPASVVVFLVALPLCLGIALASGAPLFAGIIAGIIGGIVVSLFSGSPLGVSGPAAGLAVIVLSAIQDLGTFETFLLAVVLSGIIQIILGIVKAGVIGYYFPSSVIKGMLSGIGIIIILKQIPHAFGYDKDPEGDFRFLQVDGQNTFSELIAMADKISPGALIIAAVSLAILIIWDLPFFKKTGLTKFLPGPLTAVLAGVGLNIFFKGGDFSLQSDQVVNIPVAGSISGFFTQFTTPDFTQLANPQVYITAITIAVVASLETLLCVEATDKLDPQKRVTPTNKELTAQGIGNIISGLIGGLPITQVIVRSSANIQTGGKSKASAFFHGVLLLISVMAIPQLLNLIPLASLAAVLLIVGYKLAKPSIFKEMYALGKSQFLPFIVTIIGIVFTDLLLGIALGMIVAVFHILWNNYRTPYHFNPKEYRPGDTVNIQFSEDVSFLNKASIMRTLSLLPESTNVTIDVSKTKSLHPDITEIIRDFEITAHAKNIKIELAGMENRNWNDPVKQLGDFLNSHSHSNN